MEQYRGMIVIDNDALARELRVADNAMPRQIKSNRDDCLYYWVDTLTGNGGASHIYVDDNNNRIQITTDDIGPRFRVHAW